MAETARSLIRFRLTSSVIQKITKLHFWATLWGIRGNTSALYENFNATKLCSRVSSRECQLYAQNSVLAVGRAYHPLTYGIRKLQWLPFDVISKYLQYVLSFHHKARVWLTTDRQTDRQTELRSQNCDGIAVSRGKTIGIANFLETAYCTWQTRIWWMLR